MKTTRNNLNLLIEKFLFESDDDPEGEEKKRQERKRQAFLDAASHEERYRGKKLSPYRLAYQKNQSDPKRTLYLYPYQNEKEEEEWLRKFKPSDVFSGHDEEDDDLLDQSIYDMVYKNMKRIKALEDKYQIIAGNFKVIDMNTKDNKKHIIDLNKDIVDLANLFNTKTKDS